MHMYFWTGCDLGSLLFDGLDVETTGAMVSACVLFCLLAVFFEGLKVLETWLRKLHISRVRQALQDACSGDRSQLLNQPGPSMVMDREVPHSTDAPLASERFALSCCEKPPLLSRVLVYTANSTINYFIMLVVMLYNVYLAIAVILGLTIGYYIFGHMSVRLRLQNTEERKAPIITCTPDCEDTGVAEGSTPPLLPARASPDCCQSSEPCCDEPSQSNDKDKGKGQSAVDCCEPPV